MNAVNMPAIPAEEYRALKPYVDLAERLGQFLAQISSGAAAGVEIRYSGKLAQMNTNLARNAVLKGLLNRILDEKANIVNAIAIAESRGIRISETRAQRTQFADSIRVTLKSNDHESSAEGTVLHGSDPRLLAFDGINVECPLEGNLIVLKNWDVPGVIGRVGMILAKREVNIANFSLGRERQPRGKNKDQVGAVCVVQVDGKVPPEAIKDLRKIPANTFARPVELGS